jgi:hypothetical protein
MKPREILFAENNSRKRIKFTALKSTEVLSVKEIPLSNQFFQTNACKEQSYYSKIDGRSAGKNSPSLMEPENYCHVYKSSGSDPNFLS